MVNNYPSFTHRLVRLTSPSLNYVIIGGALIMYLSIILYVVPVTSQVATTAMCNVSMPIVETPEVMDSFLTCYS